MKKKGILFLILVLSLLVNQAKTQITLTSPSITVDPDSYFSADITTSSFDDIQGVQFSFGWDPAVIEFQGVENFGLELNEINFNADMADQGKLSFLWYDNTALGVSLEDGTTIFTLRFKTIGSPGMATSISFTNDPTAIEISNVDDEVLEPTFEEGTIDVFDVNSTSTYVSDPELIRVDPIRPNPFSSSTQISFQLSLNAQTQILIYGPNGKLVFHDNRSFHPGDHTLLFTQDIFPTAGTYFFRLKAEEFLVTQQLIRL